MCFPQQKGAGRREDAKSSEDKPGEKPEAQVMLQGAVGYAQLRGLDLVPMAGFVIGVSVLLVSGELFWVRDFYHINCIEDNVGGEGNGAASTERKVLSMVWEMKVARRVACVDGAPCKV